MQVILLKDVPKVGRKGELKRVKDGYFRNFLYPRSLAALATPGRIKISEELAKKRMIEHEEMKKKAMEVKERLEKLVLAFEKKASAKGKLYGSISQKDIVKAVKDEAKVELTESQIILKDHIKAVGDFVVPINLAEGVTAEIKVEVKAQS
ncbi:50S ribosomal protein L9 [Candidatus Peregrinibacteria bacterium]|nr:50S ribosomal protein L9 [Candidatus Peregrinibacteria bacterium]